MFLIGFLLVCVGVSVWEMWPFVRRQSDAPDDGEHPIALIASCSPPADPPSTTIESANTFANVVAHLEFLGYTVSREDNGWSYAQHPDRYNFHLREFPEGVRFDTTVAVTTKPGNVRAAWVDFVNRANAQSYLTRFSLEETSARTLNVTMRALASGGYSRQAFGVVMDMWHLDVDKLNRQPDFTEPGIDADLESAPVIVH